MAKWFEHRPAKTGNRPTIGMWQSASAATGWPPELTSETLTNKVFHVKEDLPRWLTLHIKNEEQKKNTNWTIWALQLSQQYYWQRHNDHSPWLFALVIISDVIYSQSKIKLCLHRLCHRCYERGISLSSPLLASHLLKLCKPAGKDITVSRLSVIMIM